MAGHGNFIVVNVADNAFLIYHVGNPGGTQPESALHIVQPTYLSGGIAAQRKGYAVGGGKSLEPADVVGADAYDEGVPVLKFCLRVSKLPGLDRSTESGCPDEEIEDNVRAAMVRQGKIHP